LSKETGAPTTFGFHISFSSQNLNGRTFGFHFLISHSPASRSTGQWHDLLQFSPHVLQWASLVAGARLLAMMMAPSITMTHVLEGKAIP
jgi:hypothetical protein